MINDILNQCVTEIKKPENIQLLIDPIINHTLCRLKPYILCITIVFTLIVILIVTILVIILKNNKI